MHIKPLQIKIIWKETNIWDFRPLWHFGYQFISLQILTYQKRVIGHAYIHLIKWYHLIRNPYTQFQVSNHLSLLNYKVPKNRPIRAQYAGKCIACTITLYKETSLYKEHMYQVWSLSHVIIELYGPKESTNQSAACTHACMCISKSQLMHIYTCQYVLMQRFLNVWPVAIENIHREVHNGRRIIICRNNNNSN